MVDRGKSKRFFTKKWPLHSRKSHHDRHTDGIEERQDISSHSAPLRHNEKVIHIVSVAKPSHHHHQQLTSHYEPTQQHQQHQPSSYIPVTSNKNNKMQTFAAVSTVQRFSPKIRQSNGSIVDRLAKLDHIVHLEQTKQRTRAQMRTEQFYESVDAVDEESPIMSPSPQTKTSTATNPNSTKSPKKKKHVSNGSILRGPDASSLPMSWSPPSNIQELLKNNNNKTTTPTATTFPSLQKSQSTPLSSCSSASMLPTTTKSLSFTSAWTWFDGIQCSTVAPVPTTTMTSSETFLGNHEDQFHYLTSSVNTTTYPNAPGTLSQRARPSF